ncbi:hypothetical protein AOQ84DRAFT_409324 [Glonium stellatum]|uniref:Uncharacterized protein n=1 Tax=Glonium stellatum TaxID=574774 RepID=A0A8E2EYZ0_9PEZI|nr:hypothetical protein AOQ84DRAFT_409324 [Glonium stellatum]
MSCITLESRTAKCSRNNLETLRNLPCWRISQPIARTMASEEVQPTEIQVGQVYHLPPLDEIPEDSCIRKARNLSNIWDHPCVVTAIEPGGVTFCVAVTWKNTHILEKHKDPSMRAHYRLIQHTGEETHDELPILGLAQGHMQRRTYLNVSAQHFIEASALKPWRCNNKPISLSKSAMEVVRAAVQHYEGRKTSPTHRSVTPPGPRQNTVAPLQRSPSPERSSSPRLLGDSGGKYVPPQLRRIRGNS